LRIVTERSGLDRRRLLRWILAWTGLSAAWFYGDGTPFEIEARIAELATAELDRYTTSFGQ
jgi:streptomycin 6-kinase